MSLNINVNVPPRLIEQAREQQVERRLAMVQRQRQAVVRKEAARKVQQERLARGESADGKVPVGGTLEQRRRQWNGATAVIARAEVGTMVSYVLHEVDEFYTSVFSYYRKVTRSRTRLPLNHELFTYDGHSPLWPPSFILLPLKGSAFIHVELETVQDGWHAPIVTSASRCHVVNNDRYREIQTPGILNELLRNGYELIFPFYPDNELFQRMVESITWGAGFYPWYLPSYSSTSYRYLLPVAKWYRYGSYFSFYHDTTPAWTPGVFYWLRNLRTKDQDTLPDASIALEIKGSSLIPWRLGKPDVGQNDYYPGPPGWNNAIMEMESGIQEVEEGFTAFWDQVQIRSRNGQIFYQESDEADSNPRISRILHYSWDWGKPDFCRQQLLELGFKPEDLIP